ncbi:MAG TPA: hypothetical protein VN446_06785 [Candidatus Acidoferrum sp.]|nr:hypothetical protein [Candidatus Acidoferrum sp.]
MTINEVIAKVDELRPNACTPAQKTAWLSEVDAKISTEVHGEEAPVTYVWPDDGDTALLVGPPYDRLYGLYITAMTDFLGSEYDAMNVSAALFEEAMGEYARRHRRAHRPASSEGFKVM